MRYDYEYLGENTDVLKNLANDSHPFAAKLRAAKKPLIILGADTLKRSDGAAILATVQTLAYGVQMGLSVKDWKVLNVLHKVASQVKFTFTSTLMELVIFVFVGCRFGSWIHSRS